MTNLQTVQYAFSRLRLFIKKTDDAFSLFCFLFVSLKTITLATCTLNIVLYAFYLSPGEIKKSLIFQSLSIVSDFLTLLIVLRAADTPNEQVNLLVIVKV